MSYDSVHVDPEAAGRALRSWQAAVEGLAAAVRQHSAVIDGLEATRPWGGDSSGAQFSDSYLQSAPAARAAAAGLATQLGELGRNSETAVQASVDSDDAQAAALAPAQAALDATPDPGAAG